MMLAILGRQAQLSLAELESYFGSSKIKQSNNTCCVIDSKDYSAGIIDQLGGTLKLVQIDFTLKNYSSATVIQKIIDFYINEFKSDTPKLTLGVSSYTDSLSAKQISAIGPKIKREIKPRSCRIVPNLSPALSTATSFHNKLGTTTTKVEIIIAQHANEILIGRSLGTQNINAYVKRDRKRPKRDARVGMLPPKLAQIIINLSRISPSSGQTAINLLDPFCGTGVILQEASLLGFKIQGSDIDQRMIDYSIENLKWLNPNLHFHLSIGDATKTTWEPPIDQVASELFLGYPFKSVQPQSVIDAEAKRIDALLQAFLTNLRPQLSSSNRLCLAVPAWLRPKGRYQDLETIKKIELKRLGYQYVDFKTVSNQDLLYYRPEQNVARRLLVLATKD